MRNRPNNPFIKSTDIPDEYFCDREEETMSIIRLIENGNNVVLKSKRRLGKSSLLLHIFKQPAIRKGYNTLYIDLMGTRDAREFIAETQRAFLDAGFTRSARIAKQLPGFLQSLAVNLGASLLSAPTDIPSTMLPQAAVQFTLDEVFSFLEKTGKPNLVVFDEFQQTTCYPEDMPAMLRKTIQQLNNTRIIFSGSNRRLLTHLFEDATQPFYKSAREINLDILKQEPYSLFCRRMFKMYGKLLDDDAASLTYDIFANSTLSMQEVMNEVFASTSTGATAGHESVLDAIGTILRQKDGGFRETLDRIENARTRNTLRCIADLGIATGLTSTEILRKYRLDNASAVQNAIKYLTAPRVGLVTEIRPNYYRVEDKFLELWLQSKAGLLDRRIDESRSLLEKERALLCSDR